MLNNFPEKNYVVLCKRTTYSLLSGGALRRHLTNLGVLNQFAHRYKFGK